MVKDYELLLLLITTQQTSCSITYYVQVRCQHCGSTVVGRARDTAAEAAAADEGEKPKSRSYRRRLVPGILYLVYTSVLPKDTREGLLYENAHNTAVSGIMYRRSTNRHMVKKKKNILCAKSRANGYVPGVPYTT